MRITLILLVLGLSGCPKEKTQCDNCENTYPFYRAEHLVTSAKEIPDIAATEPEILKPLKRVIIFPVKSRRKTIVVFPHEFLKGLQQRGWQVVDSDTQDVKQVIHDINPDVVAIYMTDMSHAKGAAEERSRYFYKFWPEFPQQKFTKIFIAEDLTEERNRDSARYFAKNADAILARYPEAFERVTGHPKADFYHFPHAASRQFFECPIDFDLKMPQALLSGTMVAPSWYPLRWKSQELQAQAPDLVTTARPHKGYDAEVDPEQEAKDYCANITQYQISLAGAAMGSLPAPYLLAKHFEMAATGSVMVTDKFVVPLFEKLGMLEGVHYLATTPDDLEKDLKRWLASDNRENLKTIGEAGRKLVQERHSMERRVEEFEAVVYYTWAKKNGKLVR